MRGTTSTCAMSQRESVCQASICSSSCGRLPEWTCAPCSGASGSSKASGSCSTRRGTSKRSRGTPVIRLSANSAATSGTSAAQRRASSVRLSTPGWNRLRMNHGHREPSAGSARPSSREIFRNTPTPLGCADPARRARGPPRRRTESHALPVVNTSQRALFLYASSAISTSATWPARISCRKSLCETDFVTELDKRRTARWPGL